MSENDDIEDHFARHANDHSTIFVSPTKPSMDSVTEQDVKTLVHSARCAKCSDVDLPRSFAECLVICLRHFSEPICQEYKRLSDRCRVCERCNRVCVVV